MRPSDDMPRRAPRGRQPGRIARRRVLLIVAAVVVFVLATSLRAIASFYTDYLWFKSVGQTGVWRGVLGTKIALAVVFTLIFFVLAWLNLYIADRIAPRFRPAGPEEELIERYHELVGGRTGLVRSGVALLFALLAGVGVSGMWNEWLLFRNGVDFGVTDRQFNMDVGFYVFKLPFLTFLVGWLFAAITIVFILTAVAHYLNGGIRVQAPVQRVTPQVKAHLSVLLALLALIKLGGYILQQFELTTSTRGTVDGATYTDVHAQLPAIRLLALISVAAAVLFIVNIWRRGWVLPVLGVGLWALIAVIAGGIVPALMQKFQVQPAESSKERPYIVNNIEATQRAFGLDQMVNQSFTADNKLTTADITGNPENLATIDRTRLWDPAKNLAGETFKQLQSLKPFYNIGDVDVDRYTINGRVVQVLISTRELNTAGVPQTSWEATHLAFTHGYGIVAAPSDRQSPTGQPDFVVKDIPIADSAEIKVNEPAIYFGEGLSGYVIVNTKRPEIDYQKADGSNQLRDYAGKDGIPIGSLLNKVAFALRFGDFNPLVSGNLTGSSKILINRDIRSRLEAIAPFLRFDGDPYPVVIDGRVKWINDAYTTSDRYPNAQRATTESDNRGLTGTFNYARNSVKAVIDAYDGTIQLYIVDPNDPIARAYEKAFPSLFAKDPPPAALQAHFRYPEEMFRVQTNMWGRYHETNPDTFYNQSNGWNVAPDPGQQVQAAGSAATSGTAPAQGTGSSAPPPAKDRIPAYYVLMRLPGDNKLSFVLIRSFVPVQGNNQQLTAFMVASSDPATYGRLTTYRMPNNNLPPSPSQVASAISSNTEVSQLRTLLGITGGGSDLLFGNLLTVPIEQSLLYVRPVYVQATDNKIPLLRKVVVAFAGNVAVDDTLGGALRRLAPFKDLPPLPGEAGAPPTTTPGTGPSPPTATIAELLAKADQALKDADAALAAKDLAGYQAKVKEAASYITQAEQIASSSSGSSSAPGSTTTTAPGAPNTSSTTTTSTPGSTTTTLQGA